MTNHMFILGPITGLAISFRSFLNMVYLVKLSPICRGREGAQVSLMKGGQLRCPTLTTSKLQVNQIYVWQLLRWHPGHSNVHCTLEKCIDLVQSIVYLLFLSFTNYVEFQRLELYEYLWITIIKMLYMMIYNASCIEKIINNI